MRILTLLLAFGPLLLCISCVGGMEGEQTPVGTTHVRISHFAPDVPLMTVWLDDAVLFDSVAYLDVGPRFDLADGVHEIGASIAGSYPPVFLGRWDVTLGADSFWTVAITGYVGVYQVVRLFDEGRTHEHLGCMAFAHVSPDAPALYVGDLFWDYWSIGPVPFAVCTGCERTCSEDSGSEWLRYAFEGDSLLQLTTTRPCYLDSFYTHYVAGLWHGEGEQAMQVFVDAEGAGAQP